MRKNRTKHEAKKPRLAKRALALCFALIFVCSCLLPVFAHSEDNLLAGTQETVVEEQGSVDNPTEGGEDPALLNEDGEDSNEEPKNEEPKPVEPEQKPEEPKPAEQEPKTEETKPEGTTEEQPKTEGTTEESKDTAGETKPEEPKQPTTNTTGDTINQGEATYTYRFWPDKIDAFDLEQIDLAVKSGTSLNDAAQSQAGKVPCTVLTVMTNANLRDYQANVQQPTKSGYEFAGWYTVDGTTEDEFSFEQSLNFEKSKTIDVFAKWNELKAVKSDALSNGGMTVEAKVGPMANVKSVALAEPNQSDAEKLRNSIDKQLYDQSYMVAVFDITPKDKDGMDVEPQNGESVNVEISGLDFSAGDNVWVYHLTNSGRVETLSATVTSDGGVEFTTKSFSPFAVVKITEDVSSFGTEDDRLATASISSNYEMTVGGTETLSGSTTYQYGWWTYPCYYHEWTVSNNTDNKITLTANSSTATIQANSAGTVTVTHYYGYSRTYYSTEKTVVTVKEAGSTGHWVYLYVRVEGDKTQLENLSGHTVADGSLWYTIGRLWVSNLRKATWDDVPKENVPDVNKRITSGTEWNAIMEALGATGGNVDRTTIINGKNSSINIDSTMTPHVVWNGTGCGLIAGDGANDYESATGNNITWHLDGKIKVEQMRSYIIKYYDKTTGIEIQNPYRDIATVNALIDINGNTVLAPNAINYGGKTYHFVEGDPKSLSITIDEDSDKNVIKLYYEHEVKPSDIPESDKPFIMVEKRFSGLTEKSQIPENFAIKVGSNSYGVNAKNVTYSQLDTDSNAYVVRWKVEVADAGNYTVSESEYQKGGFTVTTKINGETVTDPTIGTSVTVTVPELENWNPTVIPQKNKRNFKVNMDGNTNNIFVARLKNAVMVFTQKPLSNAQRDAVKTKLSVSMPKGGTWYTEGDSIYFYSVEEQLAHGTLIIDGTTVRYDASNHEIVFSEQSFWTHVATVSYSTTKAENPEISITNTYKPKTLDIQITKNLTTHDSSKKFTFKVTGDDLGNEDKRTLVDENEIKLERVKGFEMTDRKTVTLKNVEAGMHVNVTEFDRYDYEVTATNYSTPATPNAGGEKTFNYEVVLQDGKLVLVDSTTKNVVENNHIYVTNTPATTSLTVTKTATKDSVKDTGTAFDFTLTLGDNSKGVTWRKSDGTTDSVTGTSHIFNFKLKGDESITFSGINVNDNVTVAEKDYTSEHYTTTVNGEERREKTIDSATLKRNQEAGTTVNFTNAYTTPKLDSMTIKKVVTGAFGERTKEFNFSVTLTDKEGNTVDVTHTDGIDLTNFKLKHGKSVTLNQIPVGTIITVTETGADEYKTKATNYDTYVHNRTFVYKVVEQGGVATLVTENGLLGTNKKVDGSAITVENNFDGTPDTGVLLDTLPYLILLAVAVAGGVLVVVRKRKHRDE